MSKSKKIAVILTVLFLGIIFYSINQYIYSWTGWFSYQVGNCQSKLISVSASKKDGFKRLVYPVNFANIVSSLDSNPNYSVSSTQEKINISRKFDDFDYQITFENRNDDVYYRLSINSPVGEKCTTPNFEIYKKVLQMIEDIPLDDRAGRTILSALTIHHQNHSEPFQNKNF